MQTFNQVPSTIHNLCLYTPTYDTSMCAQCFCGTAEGFEGSVSSEQCGTSYEFLCTGDPTTTCGGRDAISVYQKTAYSLVGCFQDDRASRLMGPKGSEPVMSAAVSWRGVVLR